MANSGKRPLAYAKIFGLDRLLPCNDEQGRSPRGAERGTMQKMDDLQA
jgi:hypothetical protein